EHPRRGLMVRPSCAAIACDQLLHADFFLFIIGRPPRFTLFPYTTLFRSLPIPRRCSCWCTAAPSRPTPSSYAGRRPFTSRRERRSEEHTSELQSRRELVCRLPLEKKKLLLLAADVGHDVPLDGERRNARV